MCGIVGVITNKETRYDMVDIINKMASKIRHRDPDSADIYFDVNNFCFESIFS